MDKQKQIEEMATEIARTILSCPLNQGRHCDVCKFNDKDTISYDCQSYLVAEKLLEKYQPKIPEGAVFIDRNENPCLSCPVPTGEREIADCSTICGAIQLGIDWKNQCRVLVRDYNRLEKDYKNARKETAEKFARLADDKSVYFNIDGTIYKVVHFEDIDEICKEITGDKQWESLKSH